MKRKETENMKLPTKKGLNTDMFETPKRRIALPINSNC